MYMIRNSLYFQRKRVILLQIQIKEKCKRFHKKVKKFKLEKCRTAKGNASSIIIHIHKKNYAKLQ